VPTPGVHSLLFCQPELLVQSPHPATPVEAAVLLSGGIDSAAVAHLLKSHGYRVRGVFVDYGQAARQAESVAVAKVAEALAVGRISVMTALHCFGERLQQAYTWC
jgi:7-cyano-7-deazaguanine synthase in queuosine biosynthesis